MRRLAHPLVVLGLLLVAHPVHAQDGEQDPQRTAAARALFEEGVERMDAEQWGEAADRFRRALELRESPQIRFNLAQALGKAGRLVEATEHLAQVRRDESASAEVREAAETLRAELAPRVGKLTIEIEGEAEGLAVTLDGSPVPQAMIGVAAPADPGTHEVVLRADGEVVDEQRAQVPESGAAEVTLRAPEAVMQAESGGAGEVSLMATAEPGADGGGEDEGVTGQWWFWAAIGVVIVGGVAAGVLLGMDSGEQPTRGDFEPGVVRF